MEKAKPYLVAFLVMAIYAGMSIISKVALSHGMNALVFVFYRMAFATLFLAPIAFCERKRAPPLSFQIVVKNFILALIGQARLVTMITFSQDLFNIGLHYTNPTVASAISNSVPAMTFLLAVLFRMESLNPKSLIGSMKLLGVALCLGGVATIAFYTGPMLQPIIQQVYTYQFGYAYTEAKSSWIHGTFLVISGNITWSLWIVLQGKFLLHYPSKLLLTTMQCMFAMLQSFIVAFYFERDLSKWKLGFNVDLIAVIYCGIIVTGLGYYLQSWVIEKKGPVFLGAFTPLNMVLTILISVLFMKKAVSLGSLLGGGLLIGCLYVFLWGKSKEQEDMYPPINGNEGRESVKEMARGEEEQITH